MLDIVSTRMLGQFGFLAKVNKQRTELDGLGPVCETFLFKSS